MIDKTLSDSAFLVNESRARAEALSHDPYAKLWVDDEVRALWQRFNDEVYSLDSQALAIRNRFFLEQADRFFADEPQGVFVNVAAGFTSYPYLFKNPVEAVEIDLPGVVDFKKKKLQAFQKGNLLPKRKVDYFSVDLNCAQDRQVLESDLKSRINDRPSFILLEGITYYLLKDSFLEILKLACRLQTPGSRLAMDFWIPEVTTNVVFNKFCDFLERRCGHPKRGYNLLAPSFFKDLDGYAVEVESDVSLHEREIATDFVLQDWENHLPENFMVLVRM